jgi:hypothetical protein
MAAAETANIELVLTAELQPTLTDNGLLILHVEKVKIGALGITPLARAIARKLYAHRLEPLPDGELNLTAKLMRSIIDGEPFDPVFTLEGHTIRINSVHIEPKELVVGIQPLGP